MNVANVKIMYGASVNAAQSMRARAFGGLKRIFISAIGSSRVPSAMKPMTRTDQAKPMREMLWIQRISMGWIFMGNVAVVLKDWTENFQVLEKTEVG